MLISIFSVSASNSSIMRVVHVTIKHGGNCIKIHCEYCQKYMSECTAWLGFSIKTVQN